MEFGLISLPWWGYVAVTLGFTHFTIIAVTIYLHRCQAHRAVELHPVVSHAFRLWLWLTTGMNTREWTAVHRKHHAEVESPEDPHSPVTHGIKKVLWQGAELYRESAKQVDLVAQYGYGCPDDWLETRVYGPFGSYGVILMFLIDIALFGPVGLTVAAVQMLWIPFFAAGVINGVGHWRGYRNFDTADSSTNIFPWGLLIGGEELHNNHHAFGSSAKFSVKPWEFDVGWTYIRVLETVGMAAVKKRAPERPLQVACKADADQETLRAVVGNRLHVMADYGRVVLQRVHREEVRNAVSHQRAILKSLASLLTKAEHRFSEGDHRTMQEALRLSESLATVYIFRERLQKLYDQRHESRDRLLEQLRDWCRQAEGSGIAALRDFSLLIKSYAPPAAAR